MIRRFRGSHRLQSQQCGAENDRSALFGLGLCSVSSAKSVDHLLEAAMSTPTYSPGLEGVVAGETAICTVEGGLSYRGYSVGDLAEHCTFDEVAHLLLHGELPTVKQLEAFQSRVAAARRLPPPLKDLLAALPKWTTPLDALRTAVSALGHF